ncbi:hypothetical protein [Paraburkholderia sp. Cpub6]|uniref:hypothetical protein n=1 Tax=Paraburkholderia sp. Cpub6 TaxID=2723094 RepID=UPI00161EA6B6|nr:hypothetical protein [Paraburkholderia sp. Cpub6]MBB5463793.1 hypothetical protein [Paraburkholderia sp. Cpub6]
MKWIGFLCGARAVQYLLDRRRECLARVEAAKTGNVEFESQHLDLIDSLVRDVRAGRGYAFKLDHPTAVEVFVSD